jgi:hypothetical protein
MKKVSLSSETFFVYNVIETKSLLGDFFLHMVAMIFTMMSFNKINRKYLI